MKQLDRFDLLAAMALGLVFGAVAVAPFGPKPFGDLEFHEQAKRLSIAVKGSGPASEVGFNRGAPGPILYYVPPYLTVPVGAPEQRYWLAAVTWTAAWMIVALLLLRRIASRLAGPRAGLFAMSLSVASPFSVYYSFGILAEGPAYLSAVFLLYGWAEAVSPEGQERRWPRVVMALGLLFLILCRPNAGLVLGVAGLAWLALRRRDLFAARLTAATVGGAAVLFVAVSLLIAVRGRANTSQQVGFRAELFEAAFNGRFQYRTETWDWRYWESANREGSRDYSEYQETYSQLAEEATSRALPVSGPMGEWVVRDVLSHPLLTIKMSLVRVATMHLAFVNSRPPAAFAMGPISGPIVYWTLHLVLNLIGLSIAGLALVFLWRHRANLASLWPLWAPWFALVIFHALIYAEPRYLLPAKVGQMVMAACALAEMSRRAPHTVSAEVGGSPKPL